MSIEAENSTGLDRDATAVGPAPLTGTDHRAMWITLAILGAATGYVALRIAGPYLESVLMGAALAVLFHPLKVWIEQRTGRPGLAAALTTIITVLVALVPPALIITTVIRELRQGSEGWDISGWMQDGSPAHEWIDRVAMRFGSSTSDLIEMGRNRLQEAASGVVKGTAMAAGAATGAIIGMVIAIFALHVFLVRGVWLCEEIEQHSPLGRARTRTLLDTIHDMIRASFFGVVAVAAVQGTLMGLAAWIAGLPIPALWGVVTAAVSLLPLFGSALVWIPGAIVLFTQGHVGYGIFFIVWGSVVVANCDNLIRPLVVMSSLQVSGLAVFIAILGGMQAFGLIGVFVGPVTLAVAVALLKMLREEMNPTDPAALLITPAPQDPSGGQL